jgi:cardiolipin synthase
MINLPSPLRLPDVATTFPHTRETTKRTQEPERHSKGYRVAAAIAIFLQSGLLFLSLFEPGLRYLVSNPRADPLDSDQFLRTLTALTDGAAADHSRIEVLANGENYYPAELAAIGAAKNTISLEAYIFEDGEVERMFVDALVERASSGVKVNLVTDAVGSYYFSAKEIARLRHAGGKFAWYMPARWYTWPHFNNRTHRELLIVDGRIGFTGGSGWSDHWLKQIGREPRWRDTMIRVEGPAVTGLQATFSENWLEASGEILTGKEYFPFEPGTGKSTALVVRSSPTTGRSASARVLFQVLLASAKHRIYLSTPYFLPDKSIQDEIDHAIRQRGVEVKIITPGSGTDQPLTRRSSERLFGPLLKSGAHIYEYQGRMMHAKVMMIDSVWSVTGSTNIDPRSFSLNDEVNLATSDPDVTRQLETDFAEDLRNSREVSYEKWQHRGLPERLNEWFGGLIERQQ